VTEARQALAVVRSQIVRGTYSLATPVPSVTLEEFSVRYLEHAKAHKRSWKTDEHLLKPLLKVFGAQRLSAISVGSLEQYQVRRRAEVSPRTVNMELSLLRHVFNLAIAWDKAEKNPVLEVEMFREAKRPMRILAREEERKLLVASPPHLRALILFALYTGMRRGEILGLRWDAIDATIQTITVGETKTGRIRHIPINFVAAAVLERCRADKGHFVFTWQGKPFSRFDKTWHKAIVAAKIPPIRFHDLRHTFATRLVLAGIDLVTVKELLGHQSIQMTLRYSHPAPENHRQAVDRLVVAPVCHFPKPPKPKKTP
jgi:integrase